MSLGITAQAEGVFDGFLAMGWAADNVHVLKGAVKTLMSNVPDYCIIGGKLGKCCAGWNKVVQSLAKLISSSSLDHSNIRGRKVNASAGSIKGLKGTFIAVSWNR